MGLEEEFPRDVPIGCQSERNGIWTTSIIRVLNAPLILTFPYLNWPCHGSANYRECAYQEQQRAQAPRLLSGAHPSSVELPQAPCEAGGCQLGFGRRGSDQMGSQNCKAVGQRSEVAMFMDTLRQLSRGLTAGPSKKDAGLGRDLKAWRRAWRRMRDVTASN